jgi:uncharacterized protein YkwD
MPRPCSPTRKRAALAAALFLLAVATFAGAAPAPAGAATTRLTAVESSFLTAINAVRAEHSAPQVRLDDGLIKAARAHSVEMVRAGYFQHGDFVRRLVSFGARGPMVGEDLGWTVVDDGQTDRIIRWWLASSGHRAVLLRRGFHSIGIGVARGRFHGRPDCIVVTADFQGR